MIATARIGVSSQVLLHYGCLLRPLQFLLSLLVLAAGHGHHKHHKHHKKGRKQCRVVVVPVRATTYRQEQSAVQNTQCWFEGRNAGRCGSAGRRYGRAAAGSPAPASTGRSATPASPATRSPCHTVQPSSSITVQVAVERERCVRQPHQVVLLLCVELWEL